MATGKPRHPGVFRESAMRSPARGVTSLDSLTPSVARGNIPQTDSLQILKAPETGWPPACWGKNLSRSQPKNPLFSLPTISGHCFCRGRLCRPGKCCRKTNRSNTHRARCSTALDNLRSVVSPETHLWVVSGLAADLSGV